MEHNRKRYEDMEMNDCEIISEFIRVANIATAIPYLRNDDIVFRVMFSRNLTHTMKVKMLQHTVDNEGRLGGEIASRLKRTFI